MGKKIKKLAIILAFAILFCDSISAQSQFTYRKPVFKDEFNMPANTPIDSSKWTAEIGGGGWGNQELEYYTNSVRKSAVEIC